MKKRRDNERRARTRREKTRGDQTRRNKTRRETKNGFFELFFTFVSFDQTSFLMKKSSLFPDLFLGCLFLNNNVLESFLLKKDLLQSSASSFLRKKFLKHLLVKNFFGVKNPENPSESVLDLLFF